MSALRYRDSGRSRVGFLACAGVFVLALGVSGCATTRTPTYQSGMGVGGPRGYASADGYRSPPQEIEADGLPSQAPPLRRKDPLPDDPSQPFSPNYGPPPLETAEALPRDRYVPSDLPPDFRRRLLAARSAGR